MVHLGGGTGVINEFQFDDMLAMSQGESATNKTRDILLAHIPGSNSITKSTKIDDLNGVDWWIQHQSGRALGVDVKVGTHDYSKRGAGWDNLALETWSNVEARSVGWTLSNTKITDYVLWIWKDSPRWCLLPFAMLRAVFQANAEQWLSLYPHRQQFTRRGKNNWHSECVFVDRAVIWRAIYIRYSGRTITQRPKRIEPAPPQTQLVLPF